MLTEHRIDKPSRPGLDLNGWRWLITTGLTGLASVALGGFVTTILGFEFVDGWVAWVPLTVAGLVTGAVGGLRRWWLLIPMAIAPLAWLGVLAGEGDVYPYMTGFAYWSLVIGTTAVATVVATWLVRRFAH